MLSQMAANSIFAKVRAKYGKSLTAQNYRDMTGLGSVADVASYLKNRTKYRVALGDVREAAVHRGNLERILRAGFLDELNDLCRFERSVGEQFFTCFMIEEELDRVKLLARCLSSGHPEEYANSTFGRITTHICADIGRLATAQSYADLLDCITDAKLRRTLEEFTPAPGGTLDIPSIISVLEKYRYKYQSDIIRREYTGETRDTLQKMIDTRAELDNLRLFMRGRQFFNTGSDQLRSHATPARSHLTAKQTEKIVASDSVGEINAVLRKTKYARMLDLDDSNGIDDFARRVMYHIYRRKIRMTTSPTIAMFCYVGLSNIEIENITTVIEGVRYGLDADSITKLLILS